MQLHNKKVLVVGLGRTGEDVCRFLLDRGAIITVSEHKPAADLKENLRTWKERGVNVEAGGHRRQSFLDTELIVLSPGVPMIPELKAAQAHGIPIIAEIELAARFLKGDIIGITGSNGKSTTTTLTHKILKEGGRRAFLAGNIGVPLIRFALSSRPDDLYVTELSSFQLAHIRNFRARVAVFLNLSPDHLDWHEGFENYMAAKVRLIRSQSTDDIAVLNRDFPDIWALKSGRVYGFSLKEEITPGCFLREGRIILSDREPETLMSVDEIPLPGAHNRENVMAASLVARIYDIPLPRIRQSILSFKGLEHRLEEVRVLNGVLFTNDSKATNVDATIKSIESYDRKIILILGGKDKGEDFSRLQPAIQSRVKEILILGQAGDRIARSIEGSAPIRRISSIEDAVRLGAASAVPGDVVLLAPACPSFDMFNNFEERGRLFKEEVRGLEETEGEENG